MSDNKLIKLLLAGAAVGTAVAVYAAYKRQCEKFEEELADELEDIELDDDETERAYSSISLDEAAE